MTSEPLVLPDFLSDDMYSKHFWMQDSMAYIPTCWMDGVFLTDLESLTYAPVTHTPTLRPFRICQQTIKTHLLSAVQHLLRLFECFLLSIPTAFRGHTWLASYLSVWTWFLQESSYSKTIAWFYVCCLVNSEGIIADSFIKHMCCGACAYCPCASDVNKCSCVFDLILTHYVSILLLWVIILMEVFSKILKRSGRSGISKH